MTHQPSRITTLLGSLLISANVLAGGTPFDKETVIFGPDEEAVMHSISNCSPVGSSPLLRLCAEKELDFDGDGNTDLLVGVNHTGQSRFYKGRGEGLFNPPRYFGPGIATSSWKVADLDGDLDLDIVQTSRAGGNYVYTNSGSFDDFLDNERQLDATRYRSSSAAVGDVNNDGRLDIVIANETQGPQSNPGGETMPYTHTNYVYLNQTVTPNNILFSAAIPLDPTPASQAYTRRVLLLDIEGDGDLDLVATAADNHLDQSGRGNVLYVNHFANGGAGPNPFDAPIELSPTNAADDKDVANSIAAGDLDNDGDPDLVFGTWSRMNGAVAEKAPDRYYVNNSTVGAPNFNTTATFGPQVHTTNVRLGDFDNDNDLDALMLAFEDGPNRLHRNTNDSVPGSFFENTGISIGLPNGVVADRSRGLDTADLDKDGSLDFVVVNRDQVGLRYLNNDTCTGPGNTCNPFANQGPNIRGQLADGVVPPDLPIDIDDHLDLLDVLDPDNVYPADFTAEVLAPFNPTLQKYTCTATPVGGNCPGARITPTLGLTGPLESIFVRVRDGQALSNSFETFRLTIGTGNPPTFLTTSPLPAATEDAAYTTTITANDADGDNLLFDAPNPAKPLPAWLTLTPSGTNGVTLSGTPTQAQVGSHTFALRVRDRDVGGFATNQDFTVTVNNVNDAPVITTASLPGGTQGVVYSTTVSATDPDVVPPADTLTFSATGLPAGLTITAGGAINGTPTASGSFTVAVTVNDGKGGTDTENLALQISAPGNQNPTITAPPAQTATVGTAFSVTVNASDPDSDPLTFSATGLPPGLAISATGVISGIPTTDTGSPFTVNVTANDGRGGTASASFQLTVQPAGTPPPANQAPTITTPGPQSATVGTAFSLTVTASDPDSDPLTFSATGLPTGLSMTGAVISGTPTTNTGSPFTVTVTVDDGKGGTANASFQLTVAAAPVNTPPPPASGGGDGGGGSVGLVDLFALLAMGALALVRRRRPA